MSRALWPLTETLVRFSRARLLCLSLGLAEVNSASAAPVILSGPDNATNVVGASVTFSVSATNSTVDTFNYEDQGSRTNVISTGRTTGLLAIQFDFYGVSDRMTVDYDGTQIYDTGTISGSGDFAVNYGPGSNQFATVIMNEGNDYSGSKWEYRLSLLTPIFYQWRNEAGEINGATNATYTLANLQTNQAGGYQVVLTDSSGAITSSVATLTLLAPPTFTQPPADLTVLEGASSNLSVTATGGSPLSYQWLLNSTNLPGATSASYTFTNAQAADAGNYLVILTNAAGSATSGPALLKVLISPMLTNVSGGATNFSFAYATAFGSTYVVEAKASLNDPVWTPTATNTGTGNLTNYSVGSTTSSNQFFRIVVR
jgi:Immunoglobulin domain